MSRNTVFSSVDNYNFANRKEKEHLKRIEFIASEN